VVASVPSGSGVSNTAGPIIIDNLLKYPNIDFAWALRIAAFISIPLLIIGNLFIKKRLPPREPGPLIDLKFFKDSRYCLFIGAQFLVLWGNWTPYFFIQSIAPQVGIPANSAFYLVAIINGLSLPGRIIPGIIADRIGPFNTFVPSAVSAGILTLACIGIKTSAGLYTYCVLYGLFSGNLISRPG
jgi:predicted MFS family arabinose efflux permease